MTETDAQRKLRRQMINDLSTGHPEIRAHLESMTPEQFTRMCEIAVQIATGERRHITLPDGTGVLVDGDNA